MLFFNLKNDELKSAFNALNDKSIALAAAINETSSNIFLLSRVNCPPLKSHDVPLYFNEAIFEMSNPALAFIKSSLFANFEASVIATSHISILLDYKVVIAPKTVKSPLINSVPLWLSNPDGSIVNMFGTLSTLLSNCPLSVRLFIKAVLFTTSTLLIVIFNALKSFVVILVL